MHRAGSIRLLSQLLKDTQVAAVAFAWACAANGPQEQASEATAVYLDSLPVWTLQEEGLRIGDADDPDVGFSRIRGIAPGTHGELYVAEGIDRQIRVYDADGQLLRRIGRRGQGPGEFRGISDFGVVGDTIWIRDEAAGRITLFESNGTLLGTIPIRIVHLPVDGYSAPVSFRPHRLQVDGTFSAIYHPRHRAIVPGVQMVEMPLLRFDQRGEIIDTAGWEPFTPWSVVRVGNSQPFEVSFGRDESIRLPLQSGTLFIGLPVQQLDDDGFTTFRVAYFMANGRTVFAKDVRYRPRAVDPQKSREEVIKTFAAEYFRNEPEKNRLAAFSNVVPTNLRYRPMVMVEETFRPPLHMPNAIWIRQVHVPGPRWLVIDLNEGPIAQVIEPAGIGLHASGGKDIVWGTVADTLDIPYINRYRIVRGEAADSDTLDL